MFLENTVNPKEQFSGIEVITGSMFFGKTEELIRRLKRVIFAMATAEYEPLSRSVFFKTTQRNKTSKLHIEYEEVLTKKGTTDE